MSGVVAGVWRYPVKGVGGEELAFAEVAPGRGVAFDRRWMLAVTDDISSLFAAGSERWTPWEYGVTLKKHAAAANLRAEVEERGGENGGCVLTITAKGGESRSVEMDGGGDGDCREVNEWLREVLDDPRVNLQKCRAPAWDVREMPLTVVSTASVAEFAGRVGRDISVARFRGNIVVDGAQPWSELSAGEFVFGGARFRALGGVPRCPATQVNPETARRDADVPKLLREHYRHALMGAYTDATTEVELSAGMAARL